ncbi:hypothetical protein [Jeotgalicoccus halotolerans]|nr:hypothetical protein [Jeotgalicoccus halotolerans]
MKRFLYAILKYSNDAKAVKNGKVGKRIGRRVYGKVTGRIARSIFK